MKTIILSTLGAVSLAMAGHAAEFGPLITPQELQALIDSEAAPLVLDIRGPAYEKGHVTGAISAPYARFRGPAENPGQLIPADELQATLRELGVRADQPVVVVHQGNDATDFGAAARVYWTLKSSGLADLAILDGGTDEWVFDGLPLETLETLPQPSEITIEFSDRWLATTADIDRIVSGAAPARLLDSRPATFYQGQQSHPAATRPGTLPGAENLDHNIWFSSATRVMDAATAARTAADHGIDTHEPVVTFCNTGHWAATEWFALSELAGVEDVRLYPESIVGWSQEGGKMANTPGLLANLLGQLWGN